LSVIRVANSPIEIGMGGVDQERQVAGEQEVILQFAC